MNAANNQARPNRGVPNSDFRFISLKMRLAWFPVGWFAPLAVVLWLSADPATVASFGKEFRVQIPQLAGPYAYGHPKIMVAAHINALPEFTISCREH
jgi:hypothetical protein